MSTPDYQAIARQFASAAGLDPSIFVNQIQRESGFNPRATSPAGAQGIAQFMPGTAASMGVNPWDVNSALQGAATLDKQNLKKYGGDYQKALAAYNAGGGTVDSAVAHYGTNWLAHMPSETQQYVSTILGKSTPAASNGATTASPASGSTGGILGQIKQWGEYIAIFAMAILLIIVGFLLIAGKQTVQAGKTVAKAALL
jgi:Transglycosylase SLT domain